MPASTRRAVCLLAFSLAAGAAAQTTRGFAIDPQSVPASQPNGQYYALIVGIDNYTAPLHPLKTATDDAKAVSTLLADRYGFTVKLLLDSEATRENILSSLNGYETTLHDNDNLLIYYAGHGYESKASNKAYWLPVDAASPQSPNRIIADDLTSEMTTIPARHVLVISDSCYSGGLARDTDVVPQSNGQDAFLRKMLNGRSRTLMASGGDEPVSDTGSGGHSVFASALLQSLKSDDQPLFTASDLFYGSVQRQVAGNADQVPQYAIIRNSSHDNGDFVFTRKGVSATDRNQKLSETAPVFNQAVALYEARAYLESVPLFQQACDAQSYRACAYLGVLRGGSPAEQVSGVARDIDQAAQLFRKACDHGDGKGCTNLGLFYESGKSVPKDEAQAILLHRKACNGNYPAGCANLGVMIVQGRGAAKDNAAALELFHKACDGAAGDGCVDLGLMYENGLGVPQDPAQAATLYKTGCDLGSRTGCKSLGYMYAHGQGVTQDLAQASTIYRKACDEDEASACNNLGILFQHGQGGPVQYPEAAALYRKSCEASYSAACSNLGVLYETGMGVTKALDQAAVLYRRACEGAYPTGCTYTGMMYEAGAGVTANPAQAANFYTKACTLGDADGCTRAKKLSH